MIVRGPNGEQLAIDMIRNAVDPTNPFQVNMAQRRIPPIPGTLVYPFRGDLQKDFVNIFQAWRRAGGQGPAPIQVDKIEPMQAAQGNHCVHAIGHMNPDGKGMQAFNDLMCAIDPIASFGGYSVMLDHSLLPSAVENKEQDLLKAIVTTYKMNSQVVNQQMAAQMKQKQQSDQQIEAGAGTTSTRSTRSASKPPPGSTQLRPPTAPSKRNLTNTKTISPRTARDSATTCWTSRWYRKTAPAAPATPRSGIRPPTHSSRLTLTSTRSLTRQTTGRVSITDIVIRET